MLTFNVHINRVVRISMHSAAYSQVILDAAGRGTISHGAS
ncbi:hypothetical protein P3T16_006792 [Paraburkholderia sp. GAS42]|jgi:hypothetical protein